jgi:hypothetical protein
MILSGRGLSELSEFKANILKKVATGEFSYHQYLESVDKKRNELIQHNLDANKPPRRITQIRPNKYF